MKKYIFLLALIGILGFGSCQKMLDIRPEGVLLENEAINTQSDLQKLLNSCYDASANQFNGRVQTYAELIGDNLAQPQSGFIVPIYLHTTNFFNSDVNDLYLRLYEIVFRTNFLMKKLSDGSIPVSADAAKQMNAEARFLRALMHFTAVRFWAQPYGYTADNSHLGIVIRNDVNIDPKARASVKDVYAFIIDDLTQAIANLPETNGNYASKNAAKALLAKVYFQMNHFQDALTICNELIGKYPTLSSEVNRYVKAEISPENIFSFISTSLNDNRASFYIGNFRINGSTPTALRLSNSLYTQATADTSDKRSSYYEIWNKGQSGEAYGTHIFDSTFFSIPLFTTSELKLMRAECEAELNTNVSGAINDINDIRARAYGNHSHDLPGTTTATDVITAVRAEKRLEFPLNGERVFDLKRIGAKEDNQNTGKIKIRGFKWACPGMILQFPNNEKTSVFVFNDEGGCQ